MRAGGTAAMEGVPLNADSAPPKGALSSTEHRLSFVFRIYGEEHHSRSLIVHLRPSSCGSDKALMNARRLEFWSLLLRPPRSMHLFRWF
jgi:hypothetical protein